uniref:NADH-ubiquinone oxidoreductase chain 3 n=1 Tax=Capsala katsuwoni TaxID=2904576 RepID=A0A8T9JDP8_9PLAT|nr:NADH dehydrogenase subunit 3 [Capsala katsuwoni]UOK11877.1 NADH dehydrogenase subunit 3 [Capsala katsuwoni]
MVSLLGIFFMSGFILLLVFTYHLLLFNKSLDYHNKGVWSSPFESGFSGHAVNINNFSVSFFILLVFFVVFDLEISLLLNLPTHPSIFKNFFFYFSFVLLICLGYLLEVNKGFVVWQG